VAQAPLQVTGQHPRWEDKISVFDVLSNSAMQFVANVQDYSYLAAQSLTNLLRGPHYFQDLLEQMDDIGVGSLPIVLLTGFFIGVVMVLQTGSQFTRFGQSALTGDVVADFLKNAAILAGPAVASQTNLNAWQREVIVFCYQFGTLILPTVAPAIVWVLMHRRFLERLAGRDKR